MRSYPRPKTSEEFERICLEYLRREWKRPGLVLYAKSGYAQHGVDIVDGTDGGDCWAAQCKLHEDGKALQAAEVLAEVGKADAFARPIRRYAVCTTGKKTPHAQDAIAKLNAERAAGGKFLVELIYWEDIELKFDGDDEFRERYAGSTHASVRAVLYAELAPVKTKLDDVLSEAQGVGATALDSEIDRAKRLLEAREHKVAEVLLRDLKDTKYDRLTPLQRFRCLTNLGVIEYQNGNDAEAGRLMLKATEEYPAHENALANRAHAYHILGNHEEAWKAIESARAGAPDDRRVAAAYVAYAPAAHETALLEAELGAAISDPQVLMAFAERCMASDEHEQALHFIKRMKRVGNDTHDSLFIEARAIAFPYLPDDPRDSVDDPTARARIADAVSLLERAGQVAEDSGDLRTALSIRLAQADIGGHLNDENQTERSLEEAARLAAGHSRALAGVNVMRSQLALTQGRHERAMDYAARALKHDANSDAAMLHAVALLNRNQGSDRENARRELRKLLPSLQGPQLEQALNIMVTDLLAQRRYDAALDAVRVAAGAGIDRSCSLAQEARVVASKDDDARAASLASEAAAALGETSTTATRRMIASFLRHVENFGLAVGVLLPLASKSVLTTDTKNFLAVAMSAKRDDLVMEWCKALWENKALDAAARWNYLYLLDRYDPEDALRKTAYAVEEEADPQERGALKARRVILQRRLGKPVVHITAVDVPPASSAHAHYVVLFVEALMFAGLTADAVAFAYRSVLRFPDEASAHAALIRCFLFNRDKQQPLLVVPSEVGLGVAVEVQEGDNHPDWYTIEEDYVPGLPDVVRATEPWIARLVGKRAGESVALADGSAGPRTVVIKTIEAAAVHRYRDSLHTWQMRFPEHPFLEEYQLKTNPSNGEFDFTPIVEMLRRQLENIKRIDDIYRGGAVPISLMAEGVGRTVFQAMDHVAHDDELFVNCAYATEVTSREAMTLLDSARGIVLDGTALWTLRELGAVDVLDVLPLPFGTVQQSFDAIQKESAAELEDRDGGVLSLEGGKLALREIPSEMRQKYRASWKEVEATIAKGQLLSSEAMATMPAEQRDQLISVAGEWSTHAMAAAKQHGFVLWADDRVLEFLAKEFFVVPRVWTQVVFHWLRTKGVLDDVRVQQASAKLQARRYTGTFVDAGVLIQAAKLAEWNLSSPLFERNAKVLADTTTDLRACVHMAVGLIGACMTDVRLGAMQVAVVTCILDRLKARDRSLRLVRHVLRAIPAALGLNALGANQASKIVAAWLRAHQSVVVV